MKFISLIIFIQFIFEDIIMHTFVIIYACIAAVDTNRNVILNEIENWWNASAKTHFPPTIHSK